MNSQMKTYVGIWEGLGGPQGQKLLSSWGASPSQCGCVHLPEVPEPSPMAVSVEASSRGHDQVSPLFLAPLPFLKDGGMGLKIPKF